MLPAAHDGTLKAMYIIGENPLVSDADLNHAEKSLERLEFLVVQDIFLTETARKADVVLPSACYAEKEGTFSNTERRVQRVRKAVEPPGDARNDWETICAIATRMGYPMSYGSARDIMEEIRRVTPSYAGISYERIEHEGIHWPCPNEQHPGTPILHREQFTIGKGVFHAIDFVPPAERADGDFPLYLTTGRLLYQYHTGTMTMKSEGLNDIAPECFVEISSADAGKYDVRDGGRVNIASRRGTHPGPGQGIAQGGDRDRLHPVPLRPGRRQPPDQRRPGSDIRDPGVQGLRGEAGEGGIESYRVMS